jgi:hypothetical protein
MISGLIADYLIVTNPHRPLLTSINASNAQTTDKKSRKKKHFTKVTLPMLQLISVADQFCSRTNQSN